MSSLGDGEVPYTRPRSIPEDRPWRTATPSSHASMESATLTRPPAGSPAPSGPTARLHVERWPLIGLVLLCAATVFGFFYYPTYPNYDSLYSMLWGRELLHGQPLSFEAYRAPTQHPLAIVFGAVLSLLGQDGDRVLIAITFVSFIVLVAGLYRLASRAFTPAVGLIAAGLLCTRFDFPFLAARGYIDIPFLAMVVWAAALEQEQRRRGTPVFALLALAALMRPEAWLIIGLYFLWCAYPASWSQRITYAAWTAAGPVIWALTDLAVTGDPMFSLTHTSGLAEELGRAKGLSAVPSSTIDFLVRLDKAPVAIIGILGFALAAYLVPRRIWMPTALFLIGLGTFVMVGVAGLSVIQRYLLVPSLMVMVFAAVALGGFTMLKAGRLRTVWAAVAILTVLGGVYYTTTRVNLHVFENELRFRGDSRNALEDLLDNPKVRAGISCGPVSVPNHKQIADVRWLLDLPKSQVVARTDETQVERARRGGVAIYAANRAVLMRTVLIDGMKDPIMTQPLPGFRFVAASDGYGAYVRC